MVSFFNFTDQIASYFLYFTKSSIISLEYFGKSKNNILTLSDNICNINYISMGGSCSSDHSGGSGGNYGSTAFGGNSCDSGHCGISWTNNGSTNSGGSNDKCYSGYGGACCKVSDIVKATNCENSLNDTSGWGNQIHAGFIGGGAYGNVRWECAASQITGSTDCSQYDSNRNELSPTGIGHNNWRSDNSSDSNDYDNNVRSHENNCGSLSNDNSSGSNDCDNNVRSHENNSGSLSFDIKTFQNLAEIFVSNELEATNFSKKLHIAKPSTNKNKWSIK
jgi:hypothetical protein